MMSSLLLYCGIGATAVSAGAAIAVFTSTRTRKKQLDARMEEEYGPKRS